MITIRATHGTLTLTLAAGMQAFRAKQPAISRAIGVSLQTRIRQGINAERSPEGTPWVPLKPATVRQKKGAHPILQRSGRLKRSITFELTPTGVRVGTNVPYAAVHQYGASIHRKAGDVKLHFRRETRGKHKGRALFAKPDKASYGMAAKAHTLRIPARPYLFQRDGDIPQAWKDAMIAIVTKHLEGTCQA